ncbi:hypothetical protein BGX38DRAFT_1278218 [Terfezia claveryi]|nr:hypothetical protein BGX38DRAFT_1278218 [Terfezia claveryi]
MPKSGKGKGRKAGGPQHSCKAPKSTIQVLGKVKEIKIEEEIDITGGCRSEVEDENEPSYGPWSKGNPAGFLDSGDEELIEEIGRECEELMRNQLSKDDWRSNAAELNFCIVAAHFHLIAA